MTDALRAGLTALLPRLRRFALVLTGSRDAGDALVGAACQRALSPRDDPGPASCTHPGTRLDAWLYAIMRLLWTERAPAPAAPRRSDGISLAGPTVDGVRLALGALAVEDRLLLLLVCADGFTYHEAAEVLDLPEAAVAARLARARLALMSAETAEIES